MVWQRKRKDAMSSLRFKEAPKKPKGVNKDAWDAEWVGLEVGLASAFPRSIGYLGRVSVNYRTTTLEIRSLWISRHSLVETCKYSSPKRHRILHWLDEPDQKYREYFEVANSIAEYLP